MIETTYVPLEKAAAMLGSDSHPLSVDVLLTAALEDRIRLWSLLFEWREYWTQDRRSEDPWAGDGTPAEVGDDFFTFVPLFGWHVAALLKHGRVETDVLAENDGFWKQTAGDGSGSRAVEITREEPLYVLAADVERIRSKDELPVSAPMQPERAVGPRAETTYQNIIGGLLALMLGKTPAGKPQSVFDSQATIIDALLANFPEKSGIAQRTLEQTFAEAKRSLDAR